jgi:hypothetical protein
MIVRGDMGFEHQLTDTTKIVDRFLIESGSDNTMRRTTWAWR